MLFIKVDERDNVATVLKNCEANDVVGGVRLNEAISNGHKFALQDILKGENIIKYGEVIGQASCVIQKGSHVHTHNIEGIRGRGDKQ